MSHFAIHIRSVLDNTRCDKFFVSTSSNAMSSSQLSERANTIYKKATGTEKNFNFTIIRMSVTTNVRKMFSGRETSQSLANQMSHNESTTDRFYNLTKNSQHETQDIHTKIRTSMGMQVTYETFIPYCIKLLNNSKQIVISNNYLNANIFKQILQMDTSSQVLNF